jgi:hypothetical protein
MIGSGLRAAILRIGKEEQGRLRIAVLARGDIPCGALPPGVPPMLLPVFSQDRKGIGAGKAGVDPVPFPTLGEEG